MAIFSETAQEFLDTLNTLAVTLPYKGVASTKQVIMVNKALDRHFPDRYVRIRFLNKCFRDKPGYTQLQSSKELTKNEASALISCMYIDGWERSPYWEDFVNEFKRMQ